jgi:uroporphyrinogen-III synthase
MRLKFIPYDSFTLETRSTVSHLVQTLQQHIGRRGFWYPLSGKVEQEFEGTVTEKGFKVNRIITYHNSFLPIMIGRFEERPGSTRVIVQMRLHDYTGDDVFDFCHHGLPCCGHYEN